MGGKKKTMLYDSNFRKSPKSAFVWIEHARRCHAGSCRQQPQGERAGSLVIGLAPLLFRKQLSTSAGGVRKARGDVWRGSRRDASVMRTLAVTHSDCVRSLWPLRGLQHCGAPYLFFYRQPLCYLLSNYRSKSNSEWEWRVKTVGQFSASWHSVLPRSAKCNIFFSRLINHLLIMFLIMSSFKILLIDLICLCERLLHV